MYCGGVGQCGSRAIGAIGGAVSGRDWAEERRGGGGEVGGGVGGKTGERGCLEGGDVGSAGEIIEGSARDDAGVIESVGPVAFEWGERQCFAVGGEVG